MALIAIGAELAAVKIGVTGRAVMTDILEIEIDMAGAATNPGMPVPKRVAGLRVVVELGMLPDGRPACCRMTGFATNWQGPMRIASARCVLTCCEQRKQQN